MFWVYLREALWIGLFSIYFGVKLLLLIYTSVSRKEILVFEVLYSNLIESRFKINSSKFRTSYSLLPDIIDNISSMN